VAVTDPAIDTLAKVLAAFDPSRRATLLGIAARVAANFHTVAAEAMLGGPGVDWL
jgi:hypothetical protein